ncbi:non-ribosomal peptide synthetase [Chamaesiphon polymorphus]|nr:non-ribosomal peptide synthetase [Chamaesiphon polymorphus]
MQTTKEFISNLSSLDIKLWVDDLDRTRLRCNAPKGALTVEIRNELADRKAELIDFLQQHHLDLNPTDDSIKPMQRDGNIAVSFAQARLWFFDRLEGASATYNIPVSLQLSGDLNISALKMAVMEVIRRHEALRTHFELVNDAPIQVISSDILVDIPVIDLQQLPELEQSAKVKKLAIDESQAAFDLAVAPLVRVKLLQLNNTSHVLLITMHHIISDGWSMGVFINELSELYQSFCDGKSSTLPALTLQYADFADWQRNWLTGDVLDKQLNYWKDLLTGAPPLLELPIDRPRPSIQGFAGNFVEFSLERGLSQQLTALSQRSGTTLFMTMLTAFNVLLARYSGQDDVVIGSPIANRNRRETEPLIGFFVNTLVIRTKLRSNQTFLELLESVKQNTLDAQEHQDLPFEKLVEELQPERSLSYSPLFQVMFEIENTPTGNLELPGLQITPLELENINTKFDLTLSIQESETGLVSGWEYKTELFDRDTIERMAANFQALLAGIVANPQQQIAQLPLLNEIDRHQIVETWNQTQADYPSEHFGSAQCKQCFPQLFEAQVARTPEAIAVNYGDRDLTYQELNERANRWARHLVELGVGAETLVALVSDRNLDFLTAMLAVFKAGGAYLPLNPHHPIERIQQAIVQSQVPLILTSSAWTPTLELIVSDLPNSQLLDFHQLSAPDYASDNLPIRCTPDNLAYTIYTSGSTGTPKGAMLEHRGMLNHLYAKVTDLGLSANDIVAQTAAQTFDISIWQFLIPLLVGGRVEIVTTEIAADPSQLLALVARQQISILEIVPSLLRAILQQIELNGTPPKLSLRWLLLTGETLPPQLCRQWFELYPNVPMMNAYGPTECSDDVTHYPIYTSPPAEILNLPIGRPVANTQIYILDRLLQPVPIGVPGELYVGGAGVGRGYLDAPELTQQAFIPNPFHPILSPRLYKTGDKARYLPDGNIEFLDRIDFQVKIRGFRIELGEIEAVLTQHPDIKAVTAIVREDQPGNQNLVAYIVSTQTLTNAEVRDFLDRKLPAYMIPSAFVFLEAIPLTANGKVNRKALPVPALGFNPSYVAPSNALELQLMQIWEEILHISPIGIRDNFFDLGGHSLLAVSLMARIQQQFDKKLSLATLFQGATIEHLAQIILSTTTDEPFLSTLMPLQANGSKPPLFFVHPGGGTVLSYLELARNLDPDRPVYGLESLDLDEEQTLHNKVEDMAAYYIQVMKTVQAEGPYQIGGWSFGGLVAFEIAQQLRSQGQEVATVVLLDTSPFTDPEELNVADDKDFIEELLARKNGAILGIPPELDVAQAQRLLQVFKGHILAANDYNPQPYPGTVDLFLAEGGIAADSLESIAGWQQLATHDLNVHWIPGDHHTMVTKPNVQVLAEKLQICLG